jgi:ATP-dependent Clp protease adaptor protein ClpS
MPKVLEPTTIRPKIVVPLSDEEQATRIRAAFDKCYNVILWNDDFHTFDFVARVLMQVIGINRKDAYKHAEAVHNLGKSIVATETRERAELYYEQLLAFRLTVTIEKVE